MKSKFGVYSDEIGHIGNARKFIKSLKDIPEEILVTLNSALNVKKKTLKENCIFRY